MSNALIRAMARLIRIPVRVLIRPNPRVNRVWWNVQYALGFWRYLDDMSDGDMPLSLIESWAPRPTILDLGCGTSANLPLAPGRYRHYHGVDLSSRAIEAARALGRPDTTFEVADIRTFDTARRYDAILLREVVYYLNEAEAAELLRRLPAMLTPRGRIVVQIYDEAPAEEFTRIVRACGLGVEEVPARLGDSPAGAFFVLTGREGGDRADGPGRGGSAGLDSAEPTPDRTEPTVEPDRTELAIEPDRALPGYSDPDRALPDRAGPDHAGPGHVRSGDAEPGGIRPGPAAPTTAAR